MQYDAAMKGNRREAADGLAKLRVDLFELHGSILRSFKCASAVICGWLTAQRAR